MADGGEGSLAVINQHLGAAEQKQFVKDPFWRTITAEYLKKDDTAYIELAAASGLNLLKETIRDPELATTYGTGQQIKHAVKNGAKKVILFVGGSATNDAGIGIGQACGYKFLDENEEELLTIGESLSKIKRIVKPENPLEFELSVVCDVQNPLFGPNGAAYIYGPQKGADAEMVKRLDEGLRNFAEVVKGDLNIDISNIPGAGAAGGVPGGMMAFFDTTILPGVATIMEILDFESALQEAELLITGEGKLDRQTSSGKLISGLSSKARSHQVRTIVCCGKNELTKEELEQLHIQKAYAIMDFEGINTTEAMSNAALYLEKIGKEIANYL